MYIYEYIYIYTYIHTCMCIYMYVCVYGNIISEFQIEWKTQLPDSVFTPTLHTQHTAALCTTLQHTATKYNLKYPATHSHHNAL